MIPKFTYEEYLAAPPGSTLPCECKICEKIFYVERKNITRFYNEQQYSKKTTLDYCSKPCQNIGQLKAQMVICKNCDKEFRKKQSQIKKSPNHFCSKTCAVTYNNQHKTHGTRRSKLEAWIETQLPPLYPSIDFHFNRKDTIDSELDIFIPEISLAVELNGIYHYKAIHGEDKLKRTQNNDKKKLISCAEKNIDLVLIDTSTMGHFNEAESVKYLDIIKNHIDLKLLN